MEGKKHIITTLIFCTLLVELFATNKMKIYEAYISNNMSEWKTIIDEMEKNTKNSSDFLLELINYQYGYIGYCLSEKNNDMAKTYLKLAEKNLGKLEKMNISKSITHAYKSAFYGFKIGLSPVKAPFFGPKSMKHAKLSIESDSTNAMGFVQYGNVQFYMPSVFGGSKQEAINSFLKAVSISENKNDNINDWNYLSWLVLIGQSYQELEKPEMAKKYFEKCLEIEPRFIWVKNEILPGLTLQN